MSKSGETYKDQRPPEAVNRARHELPAHVHHLVEIDTARSCCARGVVIPSLSRNLQTQCADAARTARECLEELTR